MHPDDDGEPEDRSVSPAPGSRAGAAGDVSQADGEWLDVSQAYLARYQESFQFAADSQVLTDAHGLILECNVAAAELLGCPKAFLMGKPLGLFVSAGHRARFYESLGRMAQGAAGDAFETRVDRRGEGPRDAIVRASLDEAADASRGAPVLHWILRDVTDLKRAEAARDELQRHLVSAEEEERGRIARELHDETGQVLIAMGLALSALGSAESLPAALAGPVAILREGVDRLSREVRDLIRRLRPRALDDLGLREALVQLVDEWGERAGVAVELACPGLASNWMTPEAETVIFRLVQESLTNVARHARARLVRVTVERHDRVAVVTVSDDGIGFDSRALKTPDAPGRLGLLGMRERVNLAGGSLLIRSEPGRGTTVMARIPSTGPAAEVKPHD